MKSNRQFLSITKFVVTSMASCLIASAFCKAFAAQTMLHGGQSIELVGPLAESMKDRFGDGWTTGFFVDKDGLRLQLFSEERLTKNGGVVFEGFDKRNVSTTGRYAVLPVVRQGTLEIAGERPRIEGREYCPVVETTTGCILTMQTGEICGGRWAASEDRWVNGNVDRTPDMLEKTTSGAETLWNEFSTSIARLKLRDVIVANLGISNIMACDPPSGENREAYLLIADQLRNERATSAAKYIEFKLRFSMRQAYVAGTKLVVSADRAWLYEYPYSKETTRMYIVKGDVVTVVRAVDVDWLQVDYLENNGQLLRKWIRARDVDPL